MARTVQITDNFNRADGGLGANWTTFTGVQAPQIVTNTVRGATAGNDAAANWSAGPALSNDQYAKLKIGAWVDSASALAVIVRAPNSPTLDGYLIYARRQGNTSLYRVDAGVLTQLDFVADPGWVVGDTVEIEVIGTTIKGFRNGVAISGLEITDATYTGGRAGLLLNVAVDLANAYGDDFEAGDVTAAAAVGGGGLFVAGVTSANWFMRRFEH